VEEEARRTRRSKSAVVEALTEEAVQTRRFPVRSPRLGWAIRGEPGYRFVYLMQTVPTAESLPRVGHVEKLNRVNVICTQARWGWV
jgi:hypothetical protein